MTIMRVFKKSVRFTVRSKRRFIVFMLIFAIISSFIVFFVNQVDELQTSGFLDEKGLTMQQQDDFNVSYNQSSLLHEEIEKLGSIGKSSIEAHASYYYTNLTDNMWIFSIDADQHWMSKDVNPEKILNGRFPQLSNEIIIPAGSFQESNSSNIKFKTDIVVGQTLQFIEGENELELFVVGTISIGELQLDIDVNEALWLFVDMEMFEQVINLYGKTIENTYTYAMSYTVPGQILTSSTYEAIDALNTDIRDILENGDEEIYGDWTNQNEFLPTPEAKRNSTELLVSLGYAAIGGIVLSIMFSYLISRFRRREIAVLKALGYSNRSVRTSLIAEILTTSFVGFTIGMIVLQIALLYNSNFDLKLLLRPFSILGSFIINVVIALPGVVLVSRRILKVSPAEAFRDK